MTEAITANFKAIAVRITNMNAFAIKGMLACLLMGFPS
jgi:hypothetical protein